MKTIVPFARTTAHISMQKWVPLFSYSGGILDSTVSPVDLSSWQEPTSEEALRAVALVLPVLQQLETMGLSLSITLQDKDG